MDKRLSDYIKEIKTVLENTVPKMAAWGAE